MRGATRFHHRACRRRGREELSELAPIESMQRHDVPVGRSTIAASNTVFARSTATASPAPGRYFRLLPMGTLDVLTFLHSAQPEISLLGVKYLLEVLSVKAELLQVTSSPLRSI